MLSKKRTQPQIPQSTLEATQGQISSQSPTKPPNSGGVCTGFDLRNHRFALGWHLAHMDFEGGGPAREQPRKYRFRLLVHCRVCSRDEVESQFVSYTGLAFWRTAVSAHEMRRILSLFLILPSPSCALPCRLESRSVSPHGCYMCHLWVIYVAATYTHI